MYIKYLSALIPSDNGHGRSRAHYLQSEFHLILFTFLEFVLEGSEFRDITEGGLLNV